MENSKSEKCSSRQGIDVLAILLREITAETVRSVIDLTVSDAQECFVASNVVSWAVALFTEETRNQLISDISISSINLNRISQGSLYCAI